LLIKKILICGLGSIGERHLNLLNQVLPDVELAVITSRGRSSLSHLPISYFFSTIDEALNFQPDAAIISTPSPVHIKNALPLAMQGVHLLIEKPISNNSNNVEELVNVAKKNDSIILVGYNLRYSKSLQKFKSLIDSKVAGEVLSVRAEVGQYLPTWRPLVDYRKTVSGNSSLGGGVLLELSHDIDYLQWLFGDIDSLQAWCARQSDLSIDVDDLAHLTLRHKQSNNKKQLLTSLTLDMIRRDTTRSCLAVCSKGTIKWDAATNSVFIYSEEALQWECVYSINLQRDDSYISQLAHFIECIEGKSTPLVSGCDGLKVLQVVEASIKSSSDGCRIGLN
jgi:predicted dehydrogenase